MKTSLRKAAKPRRHVALCGNDRRLVTQHPRRRILTLAAGAAVLPTLSRAAWGQAYPTRPVRIVTPTAPGSSNDIIARVMGQWLSERLSRPFVIDNRSPYNMALRSGALVNL
jgi:hypothetical protein